MKSYSSVILRTDEVVMGEERGGAQSRETTVGRNYGGRYSVGGRFSVGGRYSVDEGVEQAHERVKRRCCCMESYDSRYSMKSQSRHCDTESLAIVDIVKYEGLKQALMQLESYRYHNSTDSCVSTTVSKSQSKQKKNKTVPTTRVTTIVRRGRVVATVQIARVCITVQRK